MRLAIMQPYYLPYAGYFRLFAASDLFVIYDDVQFRKGGFIHRSRMVKPDGTWEWSTLPIKNPRLGTLIKDMEWQDTAKDKLGCSFTGKPVDFIIGSLKTICYDLSIPFNCVKSSEIMSYSHLKGQARVLAICKHLGASEYINAPGGRHLYDESAFASAGIELKFLSEYENKLSVVDRIAAEGHNLVRFDIYKHATFS